MAAHAQESKAEIIIKTNPIVILEPTEHNLIKLRNGFGADYIVECTDGDLKVHRWILEDHSSTMKALLEEIDGTRIKLDYPMSVVNVALDWMYLAGVNLGLENVLIYQFCVQYEVALSHKIIDHYYKTCEYSHVSYAKDVFRLRNIEQTAPHLYTRYVKILVSLGRCVKAGQICHDSKLNEDAFMRSLHIEPRCCLHSKNSTCVGTAPHSLECCNNTTTRLLAPLQKNWIDLYEKTITEIPAEIRACIQAQIDKE
jgi:hypothetical protein